MDISQFSKCLKELIAERDKVEVPHLGTFKAVYVPASYSDHRSTINPPSRSLSFRKKDVEPSEDNEFVKQVAQDLQVSEKQAIIEIGWCLSRINSELMGTRQCNLPGLGKLKSNSKNSFFFVADDDAEIYDDGIGLESIHIKAEEILPSQPQAGPAPKQPQQQPQQPQPQPAPKPGFHPEKPKPIEKPKPSAPPEPLRKKQSRQMLANTIIFSISVAVVIFMLVVAVLFVLRNDPAVSDFLDNLLYTEEELRLLQN